MSLGRTVTTATHRILEPVEGMHRTISSRWFDAIGPVAAPVRLAHDTIAGIVYGSIRLGGTVVGSGLDAGVALEPHTSDGLGAVVDGIWGGDPDDPASMTIRDRDGRPVPVGPDLGSAFPDATGHLVVLVHGLINTERRWHGDETRPGFLPVLEEHPHLTPVALRYNTGLRVPESGAALAAMLEDLCDHWPVPVESISLVGHSMGGLVVRSACLTGLAEEHRWPERTHHVVTLGSPHGGAPLEKLTAATARALSVFADTRPLAGFLDRRSQGIKDLRHGSVVDGDDDALPAAIHHHFVAGVVTADPRHPLGLVAGDLMVRTASGTGSGRLIPTNVAVLGGIHHFDLLHDPAVIDRVLGWIWPPVPDSPAG